MPGFVEPLTAFLQDVLEDDLRAVRVVEPSDEDDALYRTLHHDLRDDVADRYDDDDQHCVAHEILEERWSDESVDKDGIEHAVYVYDEIEVVMVFEPGPRATTVTFEAGAAQDVESFGDHLEDIVDTETEGS